MSPFFGGSPEMVRLTAARIRVTRGLWQPLTDWLLGLLDREASNLRTDGGENLTAPSFAGVLSIRILIRANHTSISVSVTAVVVVVVAVGPYRSGTHRCRAVGRTSIGTAISRAPIDPTGSGCTRYRGAGDWTGHMSVSPGTDSPAPVARGTHATPMEAAAASKTATSTTASKCIIGNQTCGDENSCG
jgi:hypothetical protein